jgi:predicted ATPase/DNA-binding CsgD family transcriptional regulator
MVCLRGSIELMDTIPKNMPLQLSSFVGREHEIAEVKHLLATSRLITLTGAGGCGKTRLALEVATHVLHTFPDGVWLVTYAPLADPALVPQVAASVLGVREQPGQPLSASLTSYLGEKHLLLVLDNCEHLVEACARLTELLLQACPQLQILATSREALNLGGEVSLPVPSLSSPEPQHLPTLEALTQFDAVRLFSERAVAAQPHFEVSAENAISVAQICHRLDGIPLAIELAAGRTKALSVQQIAARLDDRFRLLTSGSRTALPRQQTLRGAIDWSYDLLSEPEKSLLRRLSVFAGGWTLEAAVAVCAEDVLDGLFQLVNKSLVLLEAREGETRYRCLETIREYAREKFQASGEVEDTRSRHLHYFLNMAEEAEPKLTGDERFVWTARLEADYDNLRVAWAYSQQADDAEAELRLAGALSNFWSYSNYQNEGRQWLEQALVRAQRLIPSKKVRAKILFGTGLLLTFAGPLSIARERLAESAALFKELGDQRRQAYALEQLGRAIATEGDLATARPLLEESLALAQAVGDKWLRVHALSALGDLLQNANDPRARPMLEDNLALARELDDKFQLGAALLFLAGLDVKQGDLSTAQARTDEALAIFQATGKKEGLQWALGSLGDLARLEGDYEHAGTLYEEALSQARDVGVGVTWNLHNLGHVAQHHGEHARATGLFKESLSLRQQEGEKEGVAEALAGLAGVAAATQQPERAARLFGVAEKVRDAIHRDIRRQNREPYDLYLPLARAQLGEAAFTKAWAEGRAVTLEQAIHYALAEPATLPEATAASLERPSASRKSQQTAGGLTAREREVAVLIAQGKTNRAIATELVVSIKTVEAHITRILSKLGFSSRSQIAGWAIHKQLADAPQDLDTQMRQR